MGAKGTILLVDDDPAIRLAVADRLEYEGYTVVEAATAEQALRVVDDLRPDLTILDMNMPGMGGLGFLRETSRGTGKVRHPVLVFSARPDLNTVLADLGVGGILSKLASPKALLVEVERIIGMHALEARRPPLPWACQTVHGLPSFPGGNRAAV